MRHHFTADRVAIGQAIFARGVLVRMVGRDRDGTPLVQRIPPETQGRGRRRILPAPFRIPHGYPVVLVVRLPDIVIGAVYTLAGQRSVLVVGFTADGWTLAIGRDWQGHFAPTFWGVYLELAPETVLEPVDPGPTSIRRWEAWGTGAVTRWRDYSICEACGEPAPNMTGICQTCRIYGEGWDDDSPLGPTPAQAEAEIARRYLANLLYTPEMPDVLEQEWLKRWLERQHPVEVVEMFEDWDTDELMLALPRWKR